MNDFLKYWDTRIDANERFFKNYPHIANFAFSECQELWDHMESENKALLARHTSLVDAVAKMFAAHEAWTQKGGASYPDWADGRARYDAARAEVDRLIAEAGGDK